MNFSASQPLVSNKRLLHFFLVFKSWEAGIALSSQALKIILNGSFDISHSYVYLSKQNELFLTHVQYKKTPGNNSNNYSFKLLLNKDEILNIKRKKEQRCLTIIPSKIYWKNCKIKLEIVLAKGLKKHTKREKLTKQDMRKKHKNLGKILKL